MKNIEYGKQLEKIFEKEVSDYLDDIALSDFRNFKLHALAEKIKSQTCSRPKLKMLYY